MTFRAAILLLLPFLIDVQLHVKGKGFITL